MGRVNWPLLWPLQPFLHPSSLRREARRLRALPRGSGAWLVGRAPMAETGEGGWAFTCPCPRPLGAETKPSVTVLEVIPCSLNFTHMLPTLCPQSRYETLCR